MVATTTVFNNLLQQLRSSFPDIMFASGDDFRWSPSTKTVYYPAGSTAIATLLHETAHASLNHTGYENDIDLIHLERDAWGTTVELGKRFGVVIDNETVEEALDTYRDWLHARSLCPSCHQNGVQTSENTYTCVLCSQEWSVNDARSCGLKRHKIN